MEHLAPGAPADVAPHERDVRRNPLDGVGEQRPAVALELVVERLRAGDERDREGRVGDPADDLERRVVLVGGLPWWARGALRRRVDRLVTLPDVPAVADERPVALSERAGTLA